MGRRLTRPFRSRDTPRRGDRRTVRRHRSPIEDMYADWTATHEFSHLLLPRISWRQKWISEGFASYYQNVLMARAGSTRRSMPYESSAKALSAVGIRGRSCRSTRLQRKACAGAVQDLLERRRDRPARRSATAQAPVATSPSIPSWADFSSAACRQRATGRAQFFTKLDSLIDEPVFMPLYREYANTAGFPAIKCRNVRPCCETRSCRAYIPALTRVSPHLP